MKLRHFIFAMFLLCAPYSAQAQSLVNLNFNAGSFTNYLNVSGYSQQLGQIKNVTAQYRGYMGQYQNYVKQYDNLVQRFKAAGSPAYLKAEYMAQAQKLISGAAANYLNASRLVGPINGMVSNLTNQLAMKFNISNSLGQLSAAAQSLGAVTAQLAVMNAQLNTLKSIAAGNYAAALQIMGIQNYIAQLQAQVMNLKSSIIGAVNGYINGAINATFGVIMNQINAITGMVYGLKNHITNLINGAIGAINGAISAAVKQVTQSLNNIIGGVTGIINGVIGKVTGAVAGLVGQVNNMVAESLSEITGLGDGEGSFASEGGAGLGMPKMKEFNTERDFAAMQYQNGVPTEEEEVEEDFEGFIPANPPDAYFTVETEGRNAMFISDDIRSEGQSNSPITINGEGANPAYRFGGGDDAAQYFPKITKKLDAKSSYKGTSVDYEYKASDGKAPAKTMGEYYLGIMGLPKLPINNWGKAAGTNLLIPWQPTEKVPEGFGADGFFTQEGRKNVFDASTGKKRGVYNTTYEDNKASLKDGACQMVAVKEGGAYTAFPAANGTFELAEEGTEGALSMVPERIIDSSHPYAPRNSPKWQERPLPGGTTTNVCGLINLVYGKKAWENGIDTDDADEVFDTAEVKKAIDEANADPISAGVGKGKMNDDYEYYRLPITVKGGKILTTIPRVKLFMVVYQAVKADMTDNAGFAKYVACRVAILPPVKPTNYLKMSYNVQDAGSKMPWIYSISGDDIGYPDTVREQLKNVKSLKGYGTLGTSWHQILPHENFGYNMPPLLHWPTGRPASLPIIQPTPPYPGKKSKEGWATRDWEYWRTTITGVNSRFKPDESNPEEIGVHKFGALHGGWNELVAYQSNCNRYFGLNCICDYFKNFYRGSAMGYALARSSGQISIGNEPRVQVTKVQMENLQNEYSKYNYKQQTKYNKNTDISDVKTWQRILNTKQGNQKFDAIIGKKMSGGAGQKKEENWPGKGNYLLKGLDNAEDGDIIVWDSQEEFEDGHKRPLHAAYVEKVHRSDVGKTCIEISESNNGVIRDAAEITENWGRVTQRNLCKEDDPSYTYMQNGKKGLQDCSNNQLIKCWEKQWDKWKVYKYKLDTNRVTDTKTAEVKPAGQCEQWKGEFDQNQDKIRATQSGGWKDKTREDPANKNPLIEVNYQLLNKATEYGCNPNQKWNLSARDKRMGSVTNSQFTPQAPGEAPSLFDFVNKINLGSKEKKYSNVPKPQIPETPPKITFPHNPTGPLPNKTCGQKAAEFASGIKNTGGITYKDDCAGTTPSPRGQAAACNGKEYGRFGLIYGAYHNSSQNENIDGFQNASPAQAAGVGPMAIAYHNYYENLVKEPNGCRLTNLSSCAKAGDIVLVQYGNNLSRFSNYNRWLIYDGSSKFFEVQETGQVVRYGPLPSEYASMSYEVRRPACNNSN